MFEYDIEDDGTITGTGGWSGLVWNDETHKWEKED